MRQPEGCAAGGGFHKRDLAGGHDPRRGCSAVIAGVHTLAGWFAVSVQIAAVR